MEHMDEKILKAKNKMEEAEKKRYAEDTVKKEIETSIYDDVVPIYEIPVVFEERTLIEDQVTLRIPKDFAYLKEELINQVYFLGNKPQYILGNDYLQFTIGFNYTTHTIPNEHIPGFLEVAKTMIERVGPKTKIYGTDQFKVGDDHIAVLEFISSAIDQAVYNLMFYASLEGKLLIGFINFGNKYVERLKPLATEIVHSFRINHEKKQEE